MAKSTQNKTPDFETALADLTKLVDTMEHEQLPLDTALKEFERGIGLIRHCQSKLKEAEQRVQILMQTDSGETLEDFNNDA